MFQKPFIVPKECKEGTLLLWNGFVFYVRGFGCVQNQVLSTYNKSALCTKRGPLRLRLTKKVVTIVVGTNSLNEMHRLKTRQCHCAS